MNLEQDRIDRFQRDESLHAALVGMLATEIRTRHNCPASIILFLTFIKAVEQVFTLSASDLSYAFGRYLVEKEDLFFTYRLSDTLEAKIDTEKIGLYKVGKGGDHLFFLSLTTNSEISILDVLDTLEHVKERYSK